MNAKTIILIGSGAQAEYALESLQRHQKKITMVFDPIGHKAGSRFHGLQVARFDEKVLFDILSQENGAGVLVCLSDAHYKEKIFKKFTPSCSFINAIHPQCVIAGSAQIGGNVIINAGAVIQPKASVGDGCMIHSGVIVEHDNVIGDFANLAPGVTLAGGVRIGRRSVVNTGTVVAPNAVIGDDCIIGAGSVVMNDIPPQTLAYGSPARVVKDAG